MPDREMGPHSDVFSVHLYLWKVKQPRLCACVHFWVLAWEHLKVFWVYHLDNLCSLFLH